MQSTVATAFLVPLFSAASVAGWKALSRPAGWKDEDGALGFDLLIGAGGAQLAFIGTAPTRLGLMVGTGLLYCLVGMLALVAVALWCWGYEADGETPRPWSLIWPNVIGFVALAGTLAGNAYPEVTFDAVPWLVWFA
jgi:hypothetical protein